MRKETAPPGRPLSGSLAIDDNLVPPVPLLNPHRHEYRESHTSVFACVSDVKIIDSSSVLVTVVVPRIGFCSEQRPMESSV